MILQLNPTIDVATPLGDCTAIMVIDCSIDVNTIWVCRMEGGEIKHFYSDDIRMYGNPMNGKGYDVKIPESWKIKSKKKQKNKYTDFDIFKAKREAITNCTDTKLLEALSKCGYSAKYFN